MAARDLLHRSMLVVGVLTLAGAGLAADPAVAVTPGAGASNGVQAPGGRTPVVLGPAPAIPTLVPGTVIATPGALRAQSVTSTFTVNYDAGFDANPAAKAAFQAAVDQWAATITSPVPIVVDASFSALPAGVLGSAGPNSIFRGFSGAPLANTWYPGALANARHGSDLDPGNADIGAQFSSTYSGFYFGTDGMTGGKVDFESVVLHELGHGLGFLGAMNVSGGIGSCCFGGSPLPFDRFTKSNGTPLLSIPDNSAALATALQGQDVRFTGAQALAANGCVAPKLYAPASWQNGSSYAHLDEATYAAGNVNSLMTPAIGPNEVIHSPGPIALGIFGDSGWTVAGSSPACPTGGPAWQYSTLNGSGSGVSNDQFANGNALLQYGTQLHGFYANSSHSSLSHSWWDGAKWNTENLDGNGKHTTDAVGAHVTAMQYGSTLQLFYADDTTHTLRHAWFDGSWHFETLDGAGGSNGRTTNQVGGATNVVRQYKGALQVFYSDQTADKLRHAWWDGARWNFEYLDPSTSLPSSGSFLAATTYGTSLQLFGNTAAGTLRHSWYDGAWHSETLDGTGGRPGSTTDTVGDDVAVIPFGTQLDATYRDTTTGALRHTWWNGAKWSFETLDGTGGSISGHTNDVVGKSLAMLPYSGGLHLWYQDVTTGALRHAWYAGGWHVEILDGTGATRPGASTSADTGNSIAVILYGVQLQLTYIDQANGGRLQHTWWG